ncbi:MAG: glycerol-phosphate dehydrogenase, partial [Mycobacterium sp.]|nr:glycerol-phosphate dehydrogenase [Mycobacterium sp.]
MITVPDPAALLASLRARGYAHLPDVDVRIGESVLNSAIADSSERFVGIEPVILSDGGPYRTSAGPV